MVLDVMLYHVSVFGKAIEYECSLAEIQISGGSSISCGHQPRLAQQCGLLLLA